MQDGISYTTQYHGIYIQREGGTWWIIASDDNEQEFNHEPSEKEVQVFRNKYYN